MMNSNQGHSGGFFSGFLWGALLGAGAVLLLNTKKGKKLLKTLTEEGADGIANLEEFIEEAIGEKEEAVTVPKTSPTNGQARRTTKPADPPIVQKVLTSPRRFFKGIKKKA